MQTIDELLPQALDEITRRFREAAEWPLVRRNRAITARNRLYAEHAEWLGLDPSPLPLEKPQEAA
jgi:hypothetical protein